MHPPNRAIVKGHETPPGKKKQFVQHFSEEKWAFIDISGAFLLYYINPDSYSPIFDGETTKMRMM